MEEQKVVLFEDLHEKLFVLGEGGKVVLTEDCTPVELREDQELRSPLGVEARYCMHFDGSVSLVPPKTYIYTRVDNALDVVAGDLWVIAPDGQERQAREINWNNIYDAGVYWGRQPGIEYRPESGEAIPLSYNGYLDNYPGSVPPLYITAGTTRQVDANRTIETTTLNIIEHDSWFASTPSA